MDRWWVFIIIVIVIITVIVTIMAITTIIFRFTNFCSTIINFKFVTIVSD